MMSIINVVFPECLFPTARHVASGASVEGSHGRIEIEDAIFLRLLLFFDFSLDIGPLGPLGPEPRGLMKPILILH